MTERKEKPYYLRAPWDILFRENKLEKVSPWDINLVQLLTSLLEEMERVGIDYRIAGTAVNRMRKRVRVCVRVPGAQSDFTLQSPIAMQQNPPARHSLRPPEHPPLINITPFPSLPTSDRRQIYSLQIEF